MHRFLAFVTLITLVLGLTGCASGRKNAEQKAALTGYQPEPLYDKNTAAVTRYGENLFRVEAKNFNASLDPQRNADWCWAAVSAKVLDHSGVKFQDGRAISQDDLVREFAQHRRDQTADPTLLMLAMAPELSQGYFQSQELSAQREGRRENPPEGKVWNEFQPDYPGVAQGVNELLQGGVTAVAVQPSEGQVGHIYLAYAADFSIAAMGGMHEQAPYYVSKFYALDPLTGGAVELTADDQLKRVDLAGGRRAAMTFVDASIKGYNQAKWTEGAGIGNVIGDVTGYLFTKKNR